MIFQGKAVLVYLEEDNITRAYFRIQPLLTPDGPVTKEELASLPDEGFLRIVPDRNEQHTFKERMRTMCGLCMLDLRNQPAEANKIRTNKNYNPANGENNQFIVYSDAVRNLANDVFFQVVAQSDVEKAVTPVVYIRSGANMQGPVPRENPALSEDVKQLPPDSQGLHSISVNGQELLFYCPPVEKKEESIPAPAEEPKAEAVESPAPEAVQEERPEATPEETVTALDQIQQMNAACVSDTANKLNEKPASPAFIPQQQPLNGTKLYPAAQRNQGTRRVHNALMETVEYQRYASKPEAPGAVVNDSSALKAVQNPVDSFKRCLQKVCHNQADCQQAVNIFLSCPGMRQAVTDAVTQENKNLTIAAMHSQLQELEAERLMLLMQLDDARKDLAHLKKEALSELTAQEKAALNELEKQTNAIKEAYAAEEKALLALNEQRAAAEEAIQNAQTDANALYLARKNGEMLSAAALTQRLEKALKAAGFLCEEGDALSLLTSFAICRDALSFSAASCADAALAAKTLATVFNAPLALNQNQGNLLLAPGGNSPAFLPIPRKDCTAVLLSGHGDENLSLHPEIPFAMLHFAADMQAVPGKLPRFAAVALDALNAFLTESPLNEDTLAAMQAFRSLIPASPLPIMRFANALSFVAATQNALKGGVAEAMDRAVSLFILPHYLCCGIGKEEMALHLAALPRALRIWNELK